MYGKKENVLPSNPNCFIARDCASYAALRVNAKYAIFSGGTPRAKASSTIFNNVVVLPVPGGPSIIWTLRIKRILKIRWYVEFV